MSKFTLNTSDFEISVEGYDLKDASIVSGLDIFTEKLLVQEGAQAEASYRKGRTYASDLSITRVFSDKKLFEWHKECRQGKVNKRSGSIILKDDEGKNALTVNLFNIWPIRWIGPRLSSRGTNSIAYETVVLAVESVELE
jgi:phage tail-like protein